MTLPNLNYRAASLCLEMLDRADELRIASQTNPAGTTLIDCGIDQPGGLEAGRRLAEVCMAGLGSVSIEHDTLAGGTGAKVIARTDHPVAACMAAQYAGWQIAGDDYFAMGSGPLRAAAAKEKLFEEIGNHEQADQAVGVLESGKLPPEAVCRSIAADCRIEADKLALLVAPTASQAGAIQVVARTVETCLHKLHELGFDLQAVQSGMGSAPLPPVAPDDLTGIGWTNDAVLYGGSVTLWLRGDDTALADVGRKVPSNASADFGEPFLSLFERYDRDFYKIDPLLFSPARVTLVNLGTGKVHRFGELRLDVLSKSFLCDD